MAEFSGEAVAGAVEQLLDHRLDQAPERMALGYRNENWRVELGGRELLVKIGYVGTDVGKATAASRAYRLAAGTGAKVPREVFFDPACELLESRVVRILEYLPGSHPQRALSDPSMVAPFFASFGAAVATLHRARCDAFASRVGGTPNFPTWLEYLEYRVPQIIERCRAHDTFTDVELSAMFERAMRLARDVSDVVEPCLTHRDLYLDNVLIGSSGAVSAILDFDLAEAWDPMADFVKLPIQVFPQYSGAQEAFVSSYVATAGRIPEAFEQRIRVAEIVELSNAVVNAQMTGAAGYAARIRHRLDEVLASDW